MLTHDLLTRLCHARARLRTELEPPASVARIAGDAGLSTAHFITQFGAVFGETPLQCRTRARLELARDLLARGDQPVTQVCLALGFANMGSFSRLFRRRFGTAPRVYRKTAAPAVAPGCVGLMNTALAGSEISAKSTAPNLGTMRTTDDN